MVSGTKKRRKSRSPARGKASKRARISTAKPSSHSQYTGHESQASGAASAKDIYPTPKQDRSTSLPTGEDWVFRVKVISSATDLGDDLFKNAVQGLVRICFPEGILNQLGPQVLEQHMREEKAPEQNIQRMTEIFRSEIAQHITSMLAEHLDTASRVDTVVTTLLAASARALGDKLGEDILGHVTTSLLRLQARAPKNSTKWLANSGDVQEVADQEGDTSNEDSSDDEPKPRKKPKKSKKQGKKAAIVPDVDTDLEHVLDAELEPPKRPKKGVKQDKKRQIIPDVDTDLEDNAVDINPPAPPAKHKTSKNKDRKISPKWQWDVEAEELADDEVARIFSRTSDLFAYHALPIARRKLGVGASRKDIRREMQSLLDGMPEGEFKKWVESLQKLLDGDREMLDRPESHGSDNQHQSTRATPAPVETRRRSQKATKTTSGGLSHPGTHAESFNTPPHEKTIIEREIFTHPVGRSGVYYQDDRISSISEATSAFRRLSTEERHSQPHMNIVEARSEHDLRYSQRIVDLAPALELENPVTTLLWGTGMIGPLQCWEVTRTIMDNLNHRMSAVVIPVTTLSGMDNTRTKVELEQAIFYTFPNPGQPYSFSNILKSIEKHLIPWVVAEPTAFPELKAMSFVFGYMLAHITTTLDLVLGSWFAVSTKTSHQVWDMLLQSLQRRGISGASVVKSNIRFMQIDGICNSSNLPETTRRVILERVLRQFVFSHRDRFPELKATPVVTTWERKTGLSW